MTTIQTRKILARPRLICESCQLEAEVLYTNQNGMHLCYGCIEEEAE